jgi:hypothetical protein
MISDDLGRLNERLIPKTEMFKQEVLASEGESGLIKEQVTHGIWRRAKNEIIEELGGEEKILQLQKKYLEEFNEYLGSKLLLFTYDDTPERYKHFMREYATSDSRIIFYDNLPDTINSEYGLPDWHPNAKGHRLIAEDIFNFIKKNNLIPCD